MTTPLVWRISTYSGSNGSCVAVAESSDTVLVRNSNHPDRGTLAVSPGAMAAFVAACARGDLDE